jgi:hypothetical protein
MKWLIQNIPLLLLLFFPGFSSGQDSILMKKVTLNYENTPLITILKAISEKTGIHFSYSNSAIDVNQKISIKTNDASLKEALDIISEQLNIEYRIVKGQVVLKPRTGQIPEKKKFTVSGTIRDKKTGETLPGATVRLENQPTGAISNEYGFYSLSLPEGVYDLEYSYIGYLSQKKQITLSQDVPYDIAMVFNSQALGEVTIISDDQLEMLETSQMSNIRVNPKNLTTLPEFAGEVGLIKSLGTLPGIKTHSDGSAFFFVRGGNKDQNLILIDEAPIFNPAHLFGYYSVIIPDVAKNISIYKGDMPIEKGDRISSVIDVQTKDGNMNTFAMEGMLNPFIYRFSLEGPVVKEKVSYFTSFRHSNFRWIYRRQAPQSDLFLYDFNAKLNYQINPNNRVYLSFFYGLDNLTNEVNNDLGGIKWTNLASTIRWNHIFSSRLFSNFTLYGSSYEYNLLTGNNRWISAIGNLSFNSDFTLYRNTSNTLKFGFSQSFHSFNPGNLIKTDNNPVVPLVPETGSEETVFYFGSERKINRRLSYRVGARLPVWSNKGPSTIYQYDTHYRVTDTLTFADGEKYSTFINLDPRISAKYMADSTLSLKCSYGIYHQYIQLISNSISPFSSFEVWLPSGPNIKPQRADLLAIGLNKLFSKIKLDLITEIYYKWMKNQIDYEPHASLLLNPLLEGELRFGTARSYGFELMVRRTQGRLSGWISYTWSRTWQSIKGINQGNEFPAFYDRPHDFAIFISYHLSKRVNVSVNWIYYTGSAITTPVGFYEYNGYTLPLYDDKNNDRLPDYHRLDLALNWQLNKTEKKFQHNLTFAIYNFYNRHNPVSVNFNKIETKEGKYVVPANLYGTDEIMTTQRYLLGIFPSVTYKFKI